MAEKNSKKMENTDYTNYTAEQLLQDEFFLAYLLHPTESDIHFWDDVQRDNQQLTHEIACARLLSESIPYRHVMLQATDQANLWKRITSTNQLNKKKCTPLFYYFSAAASVAILVVSTLFYYFNVLPDSELSEIEKVERPHMIAQNIQLVLADQKELTIEGKESQLQYDINGELIVNSEKVLTEPAQVKEKIKYNQLLVPAGKRSSLDLSDGTKIWINANTRIVYPVLFEQEKREIYVDGEIFLDVFPDKNRPFIVKTSKIDINVLGTSFNVSAYENDSQTSVVLVTGKVNVSTKDKQKATLKPNEMYNYTNGKTEMKTVDVTTYISWKDGVYTFDNERLSVILEKLSTYYGKRIATDKQIHEMYCSGTLNLREDLMDVLKGLENTAPVLFTEEIECIKANVKP